MVKFKEVIGNINGNQIKVLGIMFEEKNEIPVGYDLSHYESNGFYPPVQLKNFPIRGRTLQLKVKL